MFLLCFFLISLVSYIQLFIDRNYLLSSLSLYLNDNLSKVIYYMEYLIILFPYISTRFDEKIKSALKTAIKLLLCSMLIGTIFIIAETIQDFNTIALYVGG